MLNNDGNKVAENSSQSSKSTPNFGHGKSEIASLSTIKLRDNPDISATANSNGMNSDVGSTVDRSGNDDAAREGFGRRIRVNRQVETNQMATDAVALERSPRQRADPIAMSTEHPRSPTFARTDRSTRSRDGPQQDQKAAIDPTQDTRRSVPIASSQVRPVPENRPRTPEGPRASADTRGNDTSNQKGPVQHDIHPARPSRYEPARANIPSARPTQGFRAPPPTGPRGSVLPGMSPPVPPFSNARPQHLGRNLTSLEPLRGVLSTTPAPKRSPPHERPEQGKGSDTSGTTPLAVHPDRAAMLGLSNRDAHAESNKLQRSAVTAESRSSRVRTSQADVPTSKLDPSVPPSKAPRGPSDWRGRPNRDLQDEDPRRLSRATDNWSHEGNESERPIRVSEEHPKSAQPQGTEEAREVVGSGKERRERDREEQGQKEDRRAAREARKEGTVVDLRKATRSDIDDRDNTGRNRSSTKSQHESSSALTKSEAARPADSSISRGQKEMLSAETRSGPREHQDTTSREAKDLSARDQKPTSQRQEEPQRRKDDRDAVARSKRDDPKESRHERSRENHHGRSSARRSPSRSHSDRGDKKERERDSERRNGSRRENRDLDHRERDRPQRESEHRRDARDRDRSGRERDSESRRASRKHERDKSADALDRGGKSGETGDGSVGGDSTLPIKRRRVLR
jgi:hypothetical protein